MNKRDGSTDEGARRFIEAVGLFFEDAGVPRIGGRLLGLLLLAERPLSLDAIARTLDVSRASVSTNGRLLIHTGMIERVSLPGDRRDYYRFVARGWEATIESVISRSQRFRRLAMDALESIEPNNATAHARLREGLDFYAFLEGELAAVLERWRTRAALSADGADRGVPDRTPATSRRPEGGATE